MPKTLVLFVYHIYNKRVNNFIRNCIFYDTDTDFVVISNNGSPPPHLPPYVRFFLRPNIGYDFGGWTDALLSETVTTTEKDNGEEGGEGVENIPLENETETTNIEKKLLYENYENFIFVNSSVIGPFLRPDFSGKWTDIFINGLVDNVKLFGSSINSFKDPASRAHVQSYIFAMNKETLIYLIRCNVFSKQDYAYTFDDAIWKKEVLMSRKIIENGWNIGSLMPYYHGIDFTFRTKPISSYEIEWLHDQMYPLSRNITWNEYKVIFIKGNRFECDSLEDFNKIYIEPEKIINSKNIAIAAKKEVRPIKIASGKRQISFGIRKKMGMSIFK